MVYPGFSQSVLFSFGTSPPSHNSHFIFPLSAWYCPRGQFTQSATETGWYCPKLHFSHVVLPFLPPVVCPGSHSWHFVRFVSFEARFHPEGHVEQTPPSSNLPNEHIWQRQLLSSDVHPLGQSLHSTFSVSSAKVFLGQSSHKLSVVGCLNLPAPHRSQLALPLVAILPKAHS